MNQDQAVRTMWMKSVGFAGALALAATAWAATEARPAPHHADPAKGKEIAATICAGCHNADGNSTVAANPRLAGLSAEYLVKQLTDLSKPPGDKTGRENPVMGAMAQTLSPDDRLDVAAWFAQQKPLPGIAGRTEGVQLGQRIYRAGLPEKAVPACAGCHGPAGDGLPVRFPRIGGQHSEYIESQLRAFREGSRRNGPSMYDIAFRLSDPEIKALAAYVAAIRSR